MALLSKFHIFPTMSLTDVMQLPLSEKLQIMEAIWEDFREQADRFEIPQSHKNLLDARRAKVMAGESQIFAWDEVKQQIGRA
jgi:putative addiction module component (TIGR02574 family)